MVSLVTNLEGHFLRDRGASISLDINCDVIWFLSTSTVVARRNNTCDKYNLLSFFFKQHVCDRYNLLSFFKYYAYVIDFQ
jgi:hypothetical protein